MIFTVVLVLIVVLSFGCSNYNSLGPEITINEFLNKKLELYDKKNKIISKAGEKYSNEELNILISLS